MTDYELAEREIDLLIAELEVTVDPDERRLISDEIRRIEHEIAEQSRWEEEGRSRGWL